MAQYVNFNSQSKVLFTVKGYDGLARDITTDKIEFYLKVGKLTSNTTYLISKSSDVATEILIDADQVTNKGKGIVYINAEDFFNNDNTIKIVPTRELVSDIPENKKYFFSILCYPVDEPTNPIQIESEELEIRSSVKSTI